MYIGDEIVWTPERLPDWASGSGKAVIRNYDPSRNFFGLESKPTAPTPGPAIEIELSNGLRVWVSPSDVINQENE
jgi:hypothetical protein